MVILSGQEYLDESDNILTTNTMNQDGNLFQVSHLAEENIQKNTKVKFINLHKEL